ncbi:MAG: ammonium transporter [Pseudomonadota bacterium]
MKKLLSVLSLVALVSIGAVSTNSFAEDLPAAAESTMEVVTDTAAVAEEVPATVEAAPAEAAAAVAPVANKGDTAWMLVSTILVTLMVIPGLALFYGGLVRQKNMLSVLMQVFMIFSLMAVLWAVYGYSVAFTGGNAFFGGLSKAFLAGITPESLGATFSKGVYIPELTFVGFQLTFAAITPALIVGAFAERMKFSAVLVFMVLWFTFAYLPMAHMVWYWDGPDAITTAESLTTVVANAGWLWAKGALDFAGGTVVHINAGVAGLVAAYVLGKRIGYGKESMTPHSLTLTMVGAALLWVGWYGFNAGSNLEANGYAALALVNTTIATGAATLSWTFSEWLLKGKPSMLGAASGAVAGLVAITPACGFVGPMGAIVIGLVVSPICYFFVAKVKYMLGYDDALDVFGVHAIGGIVGALLTGVFVNPALGGAGVIDYVANGVAAYDFAAQMTAQLWAVGTAIVVSGVVAFISLKLIDLVIGLRVSEESEREGLDTTEHGERAYHS